MFRAGDQIGPYTLIRKLGRGAFGAVWLSERRTAIVTTTAALKIPLDDDVDLETIKHEANLWVRASGHPNVLPIIEANIYDEQVIIASEYAPDGSLESWLKQHGKAPTVEAAVEIIAGVLAGLEHLHARDIIHRDLKPANILFQGNTPRLADFGIARVLKITNPSSVVSGTPLYMAPEAFDGKRSKQTDLWSVGVILYQLLTGRLPFPQSDMASLLGAIIAREPEPLPHSIPHSIQRVVRRSLHKEPSQRYQTAGEMQKALLDAASSQASAGTDRIDIGSAPTITFQPTLREPLPIVPDPIILSSEKSTDPVVSTIQPAPLPEKKRWISKYWLGFAIALLLIGAGISGYLLNKKSEPPSVVAPAKPAQSMLDMILVPGGVFQMGRNEGLPVERPAHQVAVSSFYIDRTEVTNAEYAEFVNQTNYLPPMHWANRAPPADQEQWPVANVSLDDAKAFAAWRSKRDGVSYRLPTEEEWEYAARNGSENDLYPWGNSLAEDVAVTKDTGALSSMPVGSKPKGATYRGVLDMIGNVWEWTSTQASLYPESAFRLRDTMKDSFVYRGGGYDSSLQGKEGVTAATRDWVPASRKDPTLGFRLVRAAS